MKLDKSSLCMYSNVVNRSTNWVDYEFNFQQRL